MSYRIKPTTCMSCKKEMDASTPLTADGDQPKKNDLTICAYCGTMSKFDEQMDIVPLPESEIEELKQRSPVTYWIMKRVSLNIQREKILQN